MKRALLASLLLAQLMACAVNTPPISHLQLSDNAVATGQSDSPVVLLHAVTLPDFLLRDELLTRDSDYELTYHSTQRWAEPLDLAAQRVLARQLSHRLDTRELYAYPAFPDVAPDWEISLDVRHFEAHGDDVLLTAEIRLRRQADDDNPLHVFTVTTRRALNDRGTGKRGPVIAEAMSEALAELADQIADEMAARQ